MAERKSATAGRSRAAKPPESAGEFQYSDESGTALVDGLTFYSKPIVYVAVDGQAMVEGDICLGSVEDVRDHTEMRRAELAGKPVARGVIISGSQYRWPNCTVPYEIRADLPNPARVTDAISHWEANTNFTFVLRTEANAAQYPDYVEFVPGGGCSSYVGRQGGRQPVTLGDGCTMGNTIHEIGHVVGLWHEQSREDRDTFVTINYANIIPAAINNFSQHISDGEDVGPYDYGSIMHYPRKAFSKNGQDTIVPTDANTGNWSARRFECRRHRLGERCVLDPKSAHPDASHVDVDRPDIPANATHVHSSDVDLNWSDVHASDTDSSDVDVDAADVHASDTYSSDIDGHPTDVHSSDTDVDPSDVHSSDTDSSDLDVHSSNVDVDSSDVHSSDTDVDAADVHSSDLDVDAADVHSSDLDVDAADVHSSDTDVDSSDVHSSDTDSSDLDVDAADVHSSDTDVDATDVHSSDTDSSDLDVDAADVHSSDTDVDATDVHSSDSDSSDIDVDAADADASDADDPADDSADHDSRDRVAVRRPVRQLLRPVQRASGL